MVSPTRVAFAAFVRSVVQVDEAAGHCLGGETTCFEESRRPQPAIEPHLGRAVRDLASRGVRCHDMRTLKFARSHVTCLDSSSSLTCFHGRAYEFFVPFNLTPEVRKGRSGDPLHVRFSLVRKPPRLRSGGLFRALLVSGRRQRFCSMAAPSGGRSRASRTRSWSAIAPSSTLVLVGIRSRGVQLAHRIAQKLEELAGRIVPVGSIDITPYRDDVEQPRERIEVTGDRRSVLDRRRRGRAGRRRALDRPHDPRRARRARRARAARARSRSRCWSTAAIARCRSAPISSARTSPGRRAPTRPRPRARARRPRRGHARMRALR